MSGKILIAILLVGLTFQQCTIGCLKCNALNQCVVCDSTNNYFLNGNTCSLSTQTNCNVLGLVGACVSCNTNFYLDVNSQRCLAVTNTSIISNCASYNSGQVCIACTGNFFLMNNQCAVVNSTIANCQTYTTAQLCNRCASGFVVNPTNTACVQLSSSANCLFYTFLGCRACNTGFVLNPNLYFTNFNSASYISSFYLSTQTSRAFDWIGLEQCQAATVTNCLAFAAFNMCTQCRTGYYLQAGNCILFPLPIIFGCQTYSTLITCVTCQAGYFLTSNTCVPNTVIANCLTYSGAATITTCVSCNNGFYLQGNTCVNRTVSASISNCQTVSLIGDVCAACANGFILTSDNRACLAAITNCASYAAGSTFQSSNLQCSLCSNGFYLTNSGSITVCTAGTVQFCLTFQVNGNSCTTCQNGYYLVNSNTCTAHVPIANCAAFDPTRANFCATCSAGFYNFAFTTVCVATSLITNCLTYATDGNSCIKCASGFFVNGISCAVIPSAFANCATFSSSQCSLCNAGYMVNTLPTVGTCILPLDYISAATNSPCAVLLANTSTQTPTWVASPSAAQFVISCGTCSDFSYGYAPTQPEAICINTNQLAFYSGWTAVSNCFRYGQNYATSVAIVCMQCSSGFFISGYNLLGEKTTATTCSNTCATEATWRASSGIVVDDMLGFVNICVATTAGGVIIAGGNCARYGRVTLNTIVAATLLINDYVCWAVWPGPSATLPINIMVYSITTAVATDNKVFLENPTETTQITSILTGAGYSNTVDSNSVFPNVFNYLGIMAGPTPLYTANIVRPWATGDTVIAAAALVGITLANCDIAANYLATDYGSPQGHSAVGFATLAIGSVAHYGCLRCAFGYMVSRVGSTSSNEIAPFPGCVQMTNCASSNTVYGGLNQMLNSILSCHVCSTASGSTLFPTIYYEYHAPAAAGTANWFGWAVKDQLTINGASVAVSARNGFKCAAAPASVQTTVTIAAVGSTITQCAVFGWGQRVITVPPVAAATADIGDGKYFCLACTANYYPTYIVTFVLAGNGYQAGTNFLPNYAVTACTASRNCDTQVITQFNGCGKCRSDLENLASPSFYAFADLTMANCYQSLSRNCFVLSTTSFSSTSATNACEVCKAGYFMNTDSICEQYRIPNENVSTGLFMNSYVAGRAYTGTTPIVYAAVDTDNRITRLHYLLSHKQLQYGVSSCSSGYTMAPVNPWAPRLCVWSSYVYNNTGNFAASSNFINNCVRYNLTQVNSRNICGGCTSGFIPSQDGTVCVSTASVPNCFYAQNSPNSALCYQCLPNFLNVNGVCSATTIPNCATYINDRWSFTTPSSLTCATCINGFVLSADSLSCTAGNVRNCIQYSQARPLTCTACINGFVLLTLNSVFYCYPIPGTLNCAILQDTSGTSGANFGTVSCATCVANAAQVFGTRQWTALGLTTQAQTTCMPFTTIANCNAYDQANAVIRSNNFGCTTCATGFWYSSSNYTCVPRFNTPSACLTYNPTADLCTSCNTGSFLSADSTNCVNFPNGIFQCRLYTGATTCTQCNAPYFLNNNACVLSTVITNCNTYTSNFTCAACNTGFFLQNSTSCVTSTATNCLTFTSLTVCASCALNFGLQTTNGVTNCVAVNLNNCINATSVSPFTCLTCSTGFFPNTNGVCTPVSQTIANCATYDTATTCNTCVASAVLSVARNSCNQTTFAAFQDANCAQNFLLSTPVCTQCSPGNFFVNGTCTACTNNTFASGCFSCDPTNAATCLFCRPTFFMNAAGACVAVNPTNPINPIPNPIPNSTATTIAVGVAAALVNVFYEWA